MRPDSQSKFVKYRSSIEQFNETLNAGNAFATGIIGVMANSPDEFESMFVTPKLQESEILRIAAVTDYYLELREHYGASMRDLKAALGIDQGYTEPKSENTENRPFLPRPR